MAETSILELDLRSGQHQRILLDPPPPLGGVLHTLLRRGPAPDLTAVAAGPWAGSTPGAGDLVLAGWSPQLDAPHLTTLAGLGEIWQQLSVHLVMIRGRAVAPCVILLWQRASGLELKVEAIDLSTQWAPTHGAAQGLARSIAQRLGNDQARAAILAVGSAARHTPYGAIITTVREGQWLSPVALAGTGGLGSHLFRDHHLVGIGVSVNPVRDAAEGLPSAQAARREEGQDFVRREASIRALSEQTRYSFPRDFVDGGEALYASSVNPAELSCFNHRSCAWTPRQREQFYLEAIYPHLVRPARDELVGTTPLACGRLCPLACKREVGGMLLPSDTLPVALHLGIFTWLEAKALVRRMADLGAEPLGAAAHLGWLMERLVDGSATYAGVALDRAPWWNATSFDVQTHSKQNLAVALGLLDGLVSGAPWTTRFGGGLRSASAAEESGSDGAAAYLALGGLGFWPVVGSWTLGRLFPLPLGGSVYTESVDTFRSTRDLGHWIAGRAVTAATLNDLGICSHFRGWAEEAMPALENKIPAGAPPMDVAYGRLLAQYARLTRPRFWPTDRPIQLLICALDARLRGGESASKLDYWLRRLQVEGKSAARAFWADVHAGLMEVLSR
jgi:hypothetical protein